MDAEGGSSKVSVDYEALKRIRHMNASANAILENIDAQVEMHINLFLQDFLGDEPDYEERQKLIAKNQNVINEERRKIIPYITKQALSETPLLETDLDFRANMTAAKNQIKKEEEKKSKGKEDKTKGMRAGEKELAEKKAAIEEEKAGQTADTSKKGEEQPKQKSEVIGIAKKNPTIKAFLESAPVSDALVEQYDQDHEAFHEAIEDLHSPEGGKLILALLKAINRRQGNQNRELLLFAFDIFPELFDKLAPAELNEMSEIYAKEGYKYGVSPEKIKELSIHHCAEIPFKVPAFSSLSASEQQAWIVAVIARECQETSMTYADRSRNIIKDSIHNNILNDDDQMTIISVLDTTPIHEIEFLSDNEKSKLQTQKDLQLREEHPDILSSTNENPVHEEETIFPSEQLRDEI